MRRTLVTNSGVCFFCYSCVWASSFSPPVIKKLRFYFYFNATQTESISILFSPFFQFPYQSFLHKNRTFECELSAGEKNDESKPFFISVKVFRFLIGIQTFIFISELFRPHANFFNGISFS